MFIVNYTPDKEKKEEANPKSEKYYHNLSSAPEEHKTQGWTANPFIPIPKGGSIASAPAIDGDSVYIGSCTQYFYCIDSKTGKIKWRFLAGDVIVSSPILYQDLVIFGSFDGFLYALEKNTGFLRWKFRTHNRIWSSPIAVEDVIYVGSCDENFYAIDALSGNLLWKYRDAGPIVSDIVASNGLVIFGAYGGSVSALDYKTGNRAWSFRPFHIRYPSFAISSEERCLSNFFTRSENKMPYGENGTLYIFASDRNMYALDMSGKKRWSFFVPEGPLYGNSYKGIALFGSYDNCLYAVHDGELYWKIRTGGWPFAWPLVHSDIVYFTSMDQSLYSITIDGELLWKFMTGGSIYAPPAIYNNVVYFGSDDTHLYAIDIIKKELLWRFHTGMPTRLTQTKEIKNIINEMVDFNKNVYSVWKPELKSSQKPFFRSTYTISSQINQPEVTYGTTSPYKSSTTYKSQRKDYR